MFRRISNEARARASFASVALAAVEIEPQWVGFDAPKELIAEALPEPDDADIAALLAEQPEVAPWIDPLEVRPPPPPALEPPPRPIAVPNLTPAMVAAAPLEPPPAPEPEAAIVPEEAAVELPPEPEVASAPEPVSAALPEPEPSPEPEPEPPPQPPPETPRFDALPPEPSEPPQSPPAFDGDASARVVPLKPRVYRPPAFLSAPNATEAAPPYPPAPPPAPEPAPGAWPPPRPSVDARPELEPASLSSPVTDRNGRQSMRNRRLYRRVRLGAEIEINGNPASLVDISIGGFAASDIADVYPNTIVPVVLRLTIDGIEVGTRLHARIVYATPERVSGRFIDLTASQTAFLRYIVTWRGESVGTVGTTTLLDAITGGPLQGFPPGSSNSDAPRERWWAGLIGWKIQPPR